MRKKTGKDVEIERSRYYAHLVSNLLLLLVEIPILAVAALQLGSVVAPRSVEIVVDFGAVLVVIVKVSLTILVLLPLQLFLLPVGAHVFDLLLLVELGIVELANTAQTLPEGDVLGVDGNAVVFRLSSGTDVCPSALLLLQIEASGVRDEEQGEQHARKAKPWDEVELSLGSNVVVNNSCEESAAFSNCSGESMSGGTNWGWVNFGGDEEGDTVRPKLVEKG
jgi:hypothetical protein